MRTDAIAREKFKLWFFGHLSDEQRNELFGMFGMPTDEITNHGTQQKALRRVLRDLIRGQSDE